MKLKFEKFIEIRNFSPEAKALFQEAITCYKFSAYRASLIMAYLGFMQLIKDKLIISNPANGYDIDRWRGDVLYKIKKEECWDKEVFEILIRTKGNPIFSINEGLKTQLYYWKDRRNDCAHFKKNNISQCHVEAFLEFIESNIDKFIMLEGVEFLIEQFKNFFTEYYQEKDLDALISKIFVIFNEEMFEEFLEKIYDLFTEETYESKLDTFFNIVGGIPEELNILFSELVLRTDNYESFKQLLHRKIRHNKYFYIQLCNFNTKIYTLIPPSEEIKEIFYNNEEGNYYCLLFKYVINDIPKQLREKAYNKFLKNLSYSIEKDLEVNSYMYNLLELKNHIFLDQFINNFEWANKNKSIILKLFELLKQDEDMVLKLKKIFSYEYHPFELKNIFDSNYPELFN